VLASESMSQSKHPPEVAEVHGGNSLDEPRRVIGKRRLRAGEGPPSREARAAMDQMGRYRTRAPKGIFIYPNHEQANTDRERWLVDAMVALAQERRRG
jgi:hypothetical protein